MSSVPVKEGGAAVALDGNGDYSLNSIKDLDCDEFMNGPNALGGWNHCILLLLICYARQKILCVQVFSSLGCISLNTLC